MQGTFHQYKIVSELAKKYSQSTYLAAEIEDPQRQVVLTLFTSSFFLFQHDREHLLERAQKIHNLQHKLIVPILEMGIEEVQPFVVREYLPNGSLRERLRKNANAPLELRNALAILSQIGQALAYAHQQQIVHGKLKPENILFDAHGQAILADFYYVSKNDAIIRDQSTDEYAFCYMAPEQFDGTCNQWSDQYALGCLAYELITGQVPFLAQNQAATREQHSLLPPPPWPEHLSKTSPSLEVAVRKTLAKDPAERFADLFTFLEVIQSILSPAPAFPLVPVAHSRQYKKNACIDQSKPEEILDEDDEEDFLEEEENSLQPVKEWESSTFLFEPTSPKDLLAVELTEEGPSLAEEQENENIDDALLTDLPLNSPSSPTLADLPSVGLNEKEEETSKTAFIASTKLQKRRGRKRQGLLLLALIVAVIAFAFWPFGSSASDGLLQVIQRKAQVVVPPSLLRLPFTQATAIATKQAGTSIAVSSPRAQAISSPSPLAGKITLSDGKVVPLSAGGIATPSSSGSTPSSSGSTPSSSGSTPSSSGSATPSSSGSAPSSSGSAPSSSGSAPSSSGSTPSSSGSAPSSSSSSSPGGSTQTITMNVTFAGWTDKPPPGGTIAYPQIHKTAGGTGTYADPITFAAAKNALSPGTIIYVPYLKKYFIMEDDCNACDSAWNNNHSYSVALWIGGDNNSSSSAQQSCENKLSKSNVAIEVQPPDSETVDTTPLFTDSSGCIQL